MSVNESHFRTAGEDGSAHETPAKPLTSNLSKAAWTRVAIVCAIFLISGSLRWWQARRVEASLEIGRQSPFSLATLPEIVGDWKGIKTELDPRIVRATGGSDIITRRYVDQRTGAGIDVIVLYGPTSEMFIHTPDLCYPKAGYSTVGEGAEYQVPLGEGRAAPFRSLVFNKGEGGQTDWQEVHYAWRYNGGWRTSVTSPRESERIPGMYKVQVARRVSPNESREFDNPCQAFLQTFMPEVELRINGEGGKSSPSGPSAG